MNSSQVPSSATAVEVVREQGRLLPIANIQRLMRQPLPESAKIARDVKEVVQECVSEFIGFVTSEASERLAQERRKTITGDDIIIALKTLGFDEYVPQLQDFLDNYRTAAQSKAGVRQQPAKKVPDLVAASIAAGRLDVADCIIRLPEPL